MFKIFEFLGGIMFLIAAIQFFVSPRKALDEIHEVLVAPSPRIVKGHLVLPRKVQSRHVVETKPRTELK